MEIRQNLVNLSDERYKEFNQKIIPNAKILGVSMPVLRKFAKQILREKSKSEILEFIACECEFSDEFTLKALLINGLKTDINSRIKLSEKFIHTMPNWGVCDTFCEKKHENLELWHELMMKFADQKGEFQKRFFYVFMLKNFVNSQDLQILFEVLRDEKSELYYIQMGAAWAICEFATNGFESEIYEFLKTYDNEKIKKLAIRKICESLKFSAAQKAKFKAMFA